MMRAIDAMVGGNVYSEIEEGCSARRLSRRSWKDSDLSQPHHPPGQERVADAGCYRRCAAVISEEIELLRVPKSSPSSSHPRRGGSPLLRRHRPPLLALPHGNRSLSDARYAIVTSPRYIRNAKPPISQPFTPYLEKTQTTDNGPAYRENWSAARYAIADLNAWAGRRHRTSTSDPGTGHRAAGKRHATIQYAGKESRDS